MDRKEFLRTSAGLGVLGGITSFMALSSKPEEEGKKKEATMSQYMYVRYISGNDEFAPPTLEIEREEWPTGTGRTWTYKIEPRVDYDGHALRRSLEILYGRDSKEVDEGLTRVFNEKFKGDPNILDYGGDWAIHSTVYSLHGQKDELILLALRWGERILGEATEVGGDDSYFDYFPDQVDCFRQVCRQLGLQKEYKVIADNLRAGLYKGDEEDCIPESC